MQSTTPRCTHHGLGSFHFARRYFGNRGFFLLLGVLRCFSSPGCPPPPYRFGRGMPGHRRAGSPIRVPWDRRVCAPTPGLSRLAAPFFGFPCQGIRQRALRIFPRIAGRSRSSQSSTSLYSIQCWVSHTVARDAPGRRSRLSHLD